MKKKIKIKCDCKMPKCYLELDMIAADKPYPKTRIIFVSVKCFAKKKPVEMVLNEEGIKKVVDFLKD